MELSAKNSGCSEPNADSSSAGLAPMGTGKTEKTVKCYIPPQTPIYELVLNLSCTADSSYESIQMCC